MVAERDGQNWDNDEVLLAMALYFQVPFGSIHTHNPKIIELASLLHRKPGAVALKMANIAHLDPELLASGRTGFENGSKIDKIVFDKYYCNWPDLAADAERVREKYLHNSSIHNDEYDLVAIPRGSEKERQVKQRIGQSFFSDAVKSQYGEVCCITGLGDRSLLEAAHIKPWAVSSDIEKTAPDNGLCLNALHHEMFDKGLISIDTDLHIMISPALKSQHMDEATKNWLISYSGKTILLPSRYRPRNEFIDYHNVSIFIR